VCTRKMDFTEEFKEPIQIAMKGSEEYRSYHWQTMDPAFNSDGRMQASRSSYQSSTRGFVQIILTLTVLSYAYCIDLDKYK
jgi:hypothetical protein